MNLQDWIECGYTKEQAKVMLIKHANEVEYENKAHLNYYFFTNIL